MSSSNSEPSTIKSPSIPLGYKQTEVGLIPEEWGASKVGDVCGCIVPGRNKPQLFDGDIPWITTPDLVNGTLVTTSRLGLCISKEEAKSVGSKIVPPGSVLMSCAGELGIVAMTKNEVVVNQQLHVFIPTGQIDAVFLLNALSHRKGQIENIGTKTAVPYLNKSACNSILIPLPSTPEQRDIAEALSDADGLLGGLDRLIAKKRDLKQAAMQQLLTGQTRLPGFHGEWEMATLHTLCQKIQDGTHFSPKLGGNDYLYVTSKNIRFGMLDMSTAERISASEHFKIYTRCDVKKGDLLLTKDGANTGNAALNSIDEPFSLLSSVAMLRFDSRNHSAAYFMYQILSNFGQMQIKDAMSGNAITRLTLQKIRALRFAVAPLSEQITIAEVLTEMDGELKVLELRRNKTLALKQAMMQELLTGRTRLI